MISSRDGKGDKRGKTPAQSWQQLNGRCANLGRAGQLQSLSPAAHRQCLAKVAKDGLIQSNTSSSKQT